jgi:N6-adenosine-specific RNA methylase IME4
VDGTRGGKIKRGADEHYPLMKTQAICDLYFDLDKIVDDNSHLYLWVTNNFLPDGLRVMREWGFEYKTMITWKKDRFGLGQYFRGNTEHCLFGVRGMVPYKIIEGKRQQGITGFDAPRGEHSVKPAEMRRMIEKVSTGPFLELFARQKTEGWDVWGNEIESDVKLTQI